MAIIDYHEPVSDSQENLSDVVWGGFTFTASVNYSIAAVSLVMRRFDTPLGNVKVVLRATSGEEPTGGDLAESILNIEGLLETTDKWVDFVFDTPIALTQGVKYAIIVSYPDRSGNHYVYLRHLSSDGYPDGRRIRTGNSGSSWITYATNDGIFRTHDSIPASGPEKSENPTPVDSAEKLSPLTTKKLQWDDGGGATSYNVYFGVFGAMELVSEGQTETEWDFPTDLEYGVTYQWRIDAVNDDGEAEGDVWTFSTLASVGKVRLLPFIYSAEIAYLVELGDGYMRFWYEDTVVAEIASPYNEQQRFRLQTAQIADVMRLVEGEEIPKKLMRTSPTDFVLDDIDFTYGPFQLRNDLKNPDDPAPTRMESTETARGATTILNTDDDVFSPGHVGSLFKLMHPRTTKIISTTGSALSDTLEAKGTMNLITRGTWTGTVIFQRNVNGAGWENFRTYKSNGDRNVSLAWVEEDDNVLYRIAPQSGMSSGFRAELTCESDYHSGIVRVTDFIDARQVEAVVISRLESTAPTRRWAEGAWSNVRGWPGSISFFEDRCCYGGAPVVSDPVSSIDYPTLRDVPQLSIGGE